MFLQKAQSADYQKEITEGGGFNSCDTYAVCAAINDSLITNSEQVRICRSSSTFSSWIMASSLQIHHPFTAPLSSTFVLQVAVTVELDGTFTRGMMVLDYMELQKKTHKATIIKKIDLEKFKQMLINSLK